MNVLKGEYNFPSAKAKDTETSWNFGDELLTYTQSTVAKTIFGCPLQNIVMPLLCYFVTQIMLQPCGKYRQRKGDFKGSFFNDAI